MFIVLAYLISFQYGVNWLLEQRYIHSSTLHKTKNIYVLFTTLLNFIKKKLLPHLNFCFNHVQNLTIQFLTRI